MSVNLKINCNLRTKSEKVKSVDLHPTEPWMLCSSHQGDVNIWNYETQLLVTTFKVCDLPVRTAKFVPQKNWVVTGSDDMKVRVFDDNTLGTVHAFKAHNNLIRCIVVHSTQPFILTCGDDMLIKLWNWEKFWYEQQVFKGHTDFVMQIVFNPKDNNTFVSASLDKTLKVWQLESSTANFTLESYEKGVNCVNYYHSEDKSYLISGVDNGYLKIWDYENKTCVKTFVGHSKDISAVCFHPELPIILTGSEDGCVNIWNAETFKLELSFNYGFDNVWAIAAMQGSNNIAIGYEKDCFVLKIGREESTVIKNSAGGKISFKT